MAELKKLSGRQTALIAAMADPANYKKKNKDIYEELDVSKSTFYKWLSDDMFLDELKKTVDRATDSQMRIAWGALMELIREKDIDAIKLFFEIKGKYGASAQTGANAGGGGVLILPQVNDG